MHHHAGMPARRAGNTLNLQSLGRRRETELVPQKSPRLDLFHSPNESPAIRNAITLRTFNPLQCIVASELARSLPIMLHAFY